MSAEQVSPVGPRAASVEALLERSRVARERANGLRAADDLDLTVLVAPSEGEIVRARRRLHLKAVGIVAMTVSSYYGLVIADVPLLVRLACAALLVVAVTAVATGIMHDANHGAFSSSRRVNQGMSWSLDLLGGSSWLWRFKHNTLHHGHTNVVGIDSDIDQGLYARLVEDQPWRWWHRYQHLYLWPLYGLLTLRWLFFTDFSNLARGKIGSQRLILGRRRSNTVLMIVGKVVHVTWALAIPFALHPWWAVVAFYLVCSWVLGLQLAMIFQMAHCVEEADFVQAEESHRGRAFQLHQLRTTVDITCPSAAFRWYVRWLMGGLDHQVEHHLFPTLPHTVYPKVAGRLRDVCQDKGLDYRCHVSVSAALRSHTRWLRHMGQQPMSAAV
jgi:linoleoyl-CoA desaturase